MKQLCVILALLVTASGCMVVTLDGVGRAGSEAVVVVGYTPTVCAPGAGATTATLDNLKITIGGKAVEIRSIRDVVDMEIESAESELGIPTATYRVAVIKIPEDIKPGKTEVRVYFNGEEATQKGISPIAFEIIEGKGRTRKELPFVE